MVSDCEESDLPPSLTLRRILLPNMDSEVCNFVSNSISVILLFASPFDLAVIASSINESTSSPYVSLLIDDK